MSLNVKVKDANTGEMIDGVVVKVVQADEPFSYITLEDGTTITMRSNVNQVIRLIDKWDDSGNPIYSISAGGSISITAPDKLKKEDEA